MTEIRITVTPEGCSPVPSRVRVGAIEVVAKNLDAPTVSEVEIRTADLSQVLGEKENLIEGLSGTFSATLGIGHYVVNCPGALQAHWALVVAAEP